MGKRVAVVGMGMTKQRSSRPDVNGRELISEAVRGSLEATQYTHLTGATEEKAAYVAVRERRHALNNPFALLHINLTIEDVVNSPFLSCPEKRGDMCPRTDGGVRGALRLRGRGGRIPPPSRLDTGRGRPPPLDLHQRPIREPGHRERVMVPGPGVGGPGGLRQGGDQGPPRGDRRSRALPSLQLRRAPLHGIPGFLRAGSKAGAGAFGVHRYGGKCPVNPSGGVMSSNAIGSTGLLRVAECALQIQGRAGDRQVPDAKIALATGFGGCFWSNVLLMGGEKPEKPRG